MKYDDELEHAMEILDATCDYRSIQHSKHETWHYYGHEWRIEVVYTHEGWKIVDHSRSSQNWTRNPVIADTPWEMLEELGRHPAVLAKLAKPMEV